MVRVRRRRKRAQRSPESYVSRDPAKRARQRANLRGPEALVPAPNGNRHVRAHGGYAAVALERLAQREREVYAALAADAPLRDGDGSLPRADAVVVRLLAEALCRLEDVAAWVRLHGVLDDSGDVRPAAQREAELRRETLTYLAELGMTPRARARLGLDLAAGFDLAAAMAADAVRERGT